MRERPILFSSPMVRAILDGRKTVTRRIVKNAHMMTVDGELVPIAALCPYGRPKDRLWVREAFIHEPADYCWEASVSIPCRPAFTVYRADHEGDTRGAGWTPSIHMPRWASRITLEITDVRVDRLQDISEADAIAEGITTIWPDGPRDDGGPNHYTVDVDHCHLNGPTAATVYRMLWELINGEGSWDANPWVWVIEFKKLGDDTCAT